MSFYPLSRHNDLDTGVVFYIKKTKTRGSRADPLDFKEFWVEKMARF